MKLFDLLFAFSGRHVAQVIVIMFTCFGGTIALANEPKSTEVVRWDRTPIRLTLNVNQERLIQFPAPIQPGVPPSVAQKVRIQAIDDTVYITAQDNFDYERFQVRELESGRIYLLDLRAEKTTGHVHPVRVVTSTGNDEAAQVGTTAAAQQRQPAPAAPSYGYMELTRYAAKQVYAPERLTDGMAGISRTPLSSSEGDELLVGGGAIVAVPLASWRASNNGNNLYVSAVRLTNTSREQMVLDPRRIRGHWRAATFQHTFLAPAGHSADTTTVYLISDRPYHEAVPQWLN